MEYPSSPLREREGHAESGTQTSRTAISPLGTTCSAPILVLYCRSTRGFFYRIRSLVDCHLISSLHPHRLSSCVAPDLTKSPQRTKKQASDPRNDGPPMLIFSPPKWIGKARHHGQSHKKQRLQGSQPVGTVGRSIRGRKVRVAAEVDPSFSLEAPAPAPLGSFSPSTHNAATMRASQKQNRRYRRNTLH